MLFSSKEKGRNMTDRLYFFSGITVVQNRMLLLYENPVSTVNLFKAHSSHQTGPHLPTPKSD